LTSRKFTAIYTRNCWSDLFGVQLYA